MKLVIDDHITDELGEYLLTLDGIIDVKISMKGFLTELDINCNNKFSPELIMKFIELFQKSKTSILFEFDKSNTRDYKVLEYPIGDICCDYCYRGLVMDLFENKKIKSVKSNFNYDSPNFDVVLIIEYDKDYKAEELINYIKEKNN